MSRGRTSRPLARTLCELMLILLCLALLGAAG
jgi:hypothetical protein